VVSSLDGLRVLDLSRVLAGPLCTQILGDLGADIIKIERPGAGDDTRGWGPPFLKDRGGKDTGESAYYLCCNRNKKSVTVDISRPEGQQIIRDLIAQSDIVIENFKVGGLEKYGLGYAQMKDQFPQLIYCAISGFGQNGPLAAEPGYDFMAQAMGGLMAATGASDGQPMKAGVAVSDVMTGLYATIGILAALRHRDQTGQGQMVDVALLDVTLAGMVNLAQYYLTSGTVAPRLGNAHATIVPYQVFDTSDSHIVIAVGNDAQFSRLCRVLSVPEWAEDARFKTNAARVTHRDVLVPLLAAQIQTRTTAEWMALFTERDVPAAPVNRMDQVFVMDQVKARGMTVSLPHPATDRPADLVGSPLKLSVSPVTYRHAPPLLGADTAAVLADWLGVSQVQIKTWRETGVI
jgi:crotonobetainyl-CoA:carnitine CoA-transferase CaiB-like acyl-CoA transferase